MLIQIPKIENGLLFLKILEVNMSIIIPSKSIYNKKNEKVINNVIKGVSGEIPITTKQEQTFFSLNWQPYTLQAGFGGDYTANDNPNNFEIKSITSYWLNNKEYYRFNISIENQQFIDVQNLRFNISAEYSFSEGFTKHSKTLSVSKVVDKILFTDYFFESQRPNENELIELVPANENVPRLDFFVRIDDTYSNKNRQPQKKKDFVVIVATYSWREAEQGGEYAECHITSLNFNIVGNNFYFNEKTSVSYGDTNKKYNLPSNELLISENKGTPMYERLANIVIKEYNYGKETATIRASIGEYYLEDSTLAISTKHKVNPLINWYTEDDTVLEFKEKSYGKYEYTVPASLLIAWYNNIGKSKLDTGEYEIKCIYPKESYGRIRLNKYNETGDDKDRFADISFANDYEQQTYTFTLDTQTSVYLHYCSDAEDVSIGRPQFNFEVIIKRLSDGNLTKMAFEIGDKVIPMVRRADGTDTPMSRTFSGSAKQFRVCGTKIYYDGAVWQELTLQEV